MLSTSRKNLHFSRFHNNISLTANTKSSRLTKTLLFSANIRFSSEVQYQNHHNGTISFVFSMTTIGWELKVLGPGGNDSSSRGEGDLGVAQSSLEIWTDTGNR